MGLSAQQQLGIISEISAALANDRISHWLFGGWAVDFAGKKVTRRHDDVDFVVWESDAESVETILATLGYQRGSSKHPRHQMNWAKSGTAVQINLVRRTAEGAVVSPGTFEDWPWVDGAFGDHVGEIGGVEIPIVSPRGQLEAKQQFPSHPAGRPHREKDLHDIAILQGLVDAPPE